MMAQHVYSQKVQITSWQEQGSHVRSEIESGAKIMMENIAKIKTRKCESIGR